MVCYENKIIDREMFYPHDLFKHRKLRTEALCLTTET